MILLGSAYEFDPFFLDLQMRAWSSDLDATMLYRFSIARTFGAEWPCATQETWQDTGCFFWIVHDRKHRHRQILLQVAGQPDECLDTPRRSSDYSDVMRGHEPPSWMLVLYHSVCNLCVRLSFNRCRLCAGTPRTTPSIMTFSPDDKRSRRAAMLTTDPK